MPGAPVVRPPARTPVLNTLPRRTGEREVRSSALLLVVYPLFFFFKAQKYIHGAAGIPSASLSLLETKKKKKKKRCDCLERWKRQFITLSKSEDTPLQVAINPSRLKRPSQEILHDEGAHRPITVLLLNLKPM